MNLPPSDEKHNLLPLISFNYLLGGSFFYCLKSDVAVDSNSLF